MGLEKISEYKKKLGLTNEELAKLSGVPKGTLDKILSGVTKDPKLNTLKALAKVFNCTLDDFDDEDNIPFKMELKDIIKKRREELGLTYEQLGNLVGVGKSTVRKWETGMIENMRRDNIVALAKALNISPAIIMGWETIDSDCNNNLSKEEATLLEDYNKLDTEDKNKVIDYTQLLSNQDKYKATDEISGAKNTEVYTLAAHDDGLDEQTKKQNLDKVKEIFKQMDEE